MKLSLAYDFLPRRRSLNTSLVMDLFGVDAGQARHVVAQGVEIEPTAGATILFTGPSGSGKSSLLRAVRERLRDEGATLVALDELVLPDVPLVDALPLPLRESLDLLAACGLGEAQLLLRAPAELSEGQRYRLRLAYGLAQFAPREAQAGGWLLADEFTATLDRTLAQVIAFNLRRLARRRGVGLLLATTHEDIIVDLDPDQHVRCDLDGQIALERREAVIHTERRRVSFFPHVGSASVPRPTGPISPVGITAATTWGWSAASSCFGTKSGRSASASSPRRRRRCGRGANTSVWGRGAARWG
jgi:ABC-type lipoprotein export system ATPase subunit